MRLIFRSTQTKKLRSHAVDSWPYGMVVNCRLIVSSISFGCFAIYEEKREQAVDEHRRLWPGLPLPANVLNFQRQAVFAARQRNSAEPDVGAAGTNELWADCNTEPTTILISYVLVALTNPMRNADQRKHLYESMKALFAKLFAATGGTYVEVQRICSLRRAVVRIDATGHIEMAAMCSQHLMGPLSDAWNRCRTSPHIPFITTSFESPSVWEFITFCLDPAIAKQFQVTSQTQGLALGLLAHFGQHLDEHAVEICKGEAAKRLKEELMRHKTRLGANRPTFAVMLGTAQAMWKDSLVSATDGQRKKPSQDCFAVAVFAIF